MKVQKKTCIILLTILLLTVTVLTILLVPPDSTIQPPLKPDNSINMLMAAFAVGTVVFAIILLITLLIFKRALKKVYKNKKLDVKLVGKMFYT